MASPKLSILIASTSSRQLMTEDLIAHIEAQGGNVEIILDWNEINNVGKKRNDLLQRANGDYIVFIDSDDMVVSTYVHKILKATEGDPDCIGISGMMTTNGDHPQQWHISKAYERWYEENGIYYRTPNHISPVRRELALQTMFKEISHGEDYDYSMRLLPLLKTENIIQGNMYLYDYWHKDIG